MNLSHPYGQSVNDHMDKDVFDSSPFILKFSSIDNIARYQDIKDTAGTQYISKPKGSSG